MPNLIISALILAIGFFGGNAVSKHTISLYDNGANNVTFGATSYPGALDSLVNPGATDSVAVISHSSQHANANDAIEALQAKLGITSSTAVTGSILAGNGAGSSVWTTWATTTRISTDFASSTNFIAYGSSTLQNFTFVNATGTSATTTNFFATTASSTNTFGGGLSNCNSAGSKLLWDSGRFSCGTDDTATGNFGATTTALTAKATTTALTSGQTVGIWAKCAMTNTGSISTALYVKPVGSATSSALSVATQGTNDGSNQTITQVNFGLYTVTASVNHEIYIGTNDANKNYASCDADTIPGIMYLKF